jgi:hypothetical protein
MGKNKLPHVHRQNAFVGRGKSSSGDILLKGKSDEERTKK